MKSVKLSTLSTGLRTPNCTIELQPEQNDPLVLNNGVYVQQGEVPEGLFIPLLRDVFELPDEVFSNELPPGQTDDGVTLGPLQSFGISPVTEKPINSVPYNNCIGFSAVGERRNDHRQLAVQGHFVEGVTRFSITLDDKRFLKDLCIESIERALWTLRQSTKERSVDVVIFGGRFQLSDREKFEESVQAYINTVLDINSIVEDVLNQSASILAPSIGDLGRWCSTDTQNRRLIIRPEEGQSGSQPHVVCSPTDVREAIEKRFDLS